MRIKQLEVVGFKSFAQRTVLEFHSGITAIVGPNGCGKSNVVDAIRWVLGEQSPRHLRGDSMEDVVFKGNDRFAPTGMAQVSLTFENDPAERREATELDLDMSTLPAHFRDLAEITVTRRYHRSGESEYFINRTPCRLKDITELFLGTGVGSKAYAIIEQGRVEQLINSKPEDRRLFIEEAAGTTLYRSRKLAAERKMERTRENLLRVNDVLRELERQIQYLHRLAKKAEQFRTLQEEVRQLDTALAARQYGDLDAAANVLEMELQSLRERETETSSRLEELAERRVAASAVHAEVEEELARQREAAATLDVERAAGEQRVAMQRREIEDRTRRLVRLEEDVTRLAEQDVEIRSTMEREEQVYEEVQGLVATDGAELAGKEADFTALRDELDALRVSLEQAKSAVLQLVTREHEHSNAMAAHNRQRDEAVRRFERLDAESQTAEERLGVLRRDLLERNATAAALRDTVHATKGDRERAAERLRSVATELRLREREASEADSIRVQCRSKLESLEELQRNHEGYQPGVRAILQEPVREAAVLGVVGDVLSVPAQYERAVAAALGERLQYVIVRDGSDGIDAVTTLRDAESGRGSFIPLEPRNFDLNGHGSRSLNGNTRRLIELIDVDEPYRQIAETLLGEVVLVPDLQSGLAIWRRNGVHVTMVTPEGDTIDPSGVVTGGSERALEEDIVARRRHIAELRAQFEAAEQVLTSARAAAELLSEELAVAEANLKSLDASLHVRTVELVSADKDLERLTAEEPRSAERLEVVQFEMRNLAAERDQHAAAIVLLERELSDSVAVRVAAEEQLRSRQETLAGVAQKVDLLAADVTATKVRVAEHRQRAEAATAALARLRQQLESGARRRETLLVDGQQLEADRARVSEAVEDEVRLAAERAEKALMVEASLREAKARLQHEEARRTEIEHDAKQAQHGLDSLRQATTRSEVSLAEHRLRLEHIRTGIREKYSLEIQDHQAEKLEDYAAAGARLEVLRERLVRIGEVNVGAIDELAELEQRAAFLKQQKGDLEQSLDDLEKTIQRLNRASKDKFAETFHAVNAKFQEVFPRLFRGGEARLVLTDESNLLESGIEIVVRPPGKRLETVTLLSGGEKALVAVSLIFSLFLINPTPFCFLDEVDAPLDDANIGRFTDMVKAMSDHSQFIVITHNKRTMQAAEVLYGVTMQEPGVSKVISVAMH